jgi:tripartite-type tricarboxylate transporter receptor subunit TctC
MTPGIIRSGLAASALVIGLALMPLTKAPLQPNSTRQITLVVPFPPGGGVDLVGRLVGQQLSAELGQPVIVENRGGAGGMLGTRYIAHAVPDGNTLGIMLTGIGLSPNAEYNVNKDFAPIGLIASTPVFIVSHPSFPAKSLTDVIALAKKQPGKLAIGTPASPTLDYFALKLFNRVADVDTTVVTYRGTAPLTTDIIGNHVPLGFDTIPAAISNVRSGQLRGIAVADTKRSAALPDVPTAAESGLPGFEAVQYYGLVAPAGVPRPIIDRLNKGLRAALASEAFKQRLVDAGDDPAPSTPEDYAANINREEGKWVALIKELGLKVE